MVHGLLTDSDALVFNLDKCGYASDLTSIEALPDAAERHTLLKVDLCDTGATAAAIQKAHPDLVMHLAAESHVDRSIEGPRCLRLDKLAGLRLHHQQREWHVPSAAGGARPLATAAGEAPGGLPLSPHQH